MSDDSLERPRALQRVSDAERERAAEFVRTAVTDGRLGLDEIDVRLGAALAARTRGDLEAALVDLPGAELVLASAQELSAPAAVARERLLIEGSAASVRRDGRWDVPADILVDVSMSNVVLDFTEAVITSRTIRVELDLSTSSLILVLPDDIRVDSDDVAVAMSSITIKPPREEVPARALVHLTGEINLSSVTSSGPGWFRRRAMRRAAARGDASRGELA